MFYFTQRGSEVIYVQQKIQENICRFNSHPSVRQYSTMRMNFTDMTGNLRLFTQRASNVDLVFTACDFVSVWFCLKVTGWEQTEEREVRAPAAAAAEWGSSSTAFIHSQVWLTPRLHTNTAHRESWLHADRKSLLHHTIKLSEVRAGLMHHTTQCSLQADGSTAGLKLSYSDVICSYFKMTSKALRSRQVLVNLVLNVFS